MGANEDVTAGRRRLWYEMISIVFVCATTILHHNLFVSTNGILAQSIRMCCVLWMCFWIHRGMLAMKWLCVLTFTIYGVALIPFLFQFDDEKPLVWVSYAFNCFAFLMFPQSLIWSRNINAFLRYQRQ